MSSAPAWFSDPKVIAAFFGGASALFVSIISGLINATKRKAEVDKLRAETEKLKVETDLLKENSQNIESFIDYGIKEEGEIEVFEGKNITGYDFKLNLAKCYSNNASYGKRAEGEYQLSDGVINVDRHNKDGRLELVLLKYIYDEIETDYIPRDTLLIGNRKLHLHFSVKITGGTQVIRAVVKDKDKNKWLAQKTITVDGSEWVSVDAYFSIPADRKSFIRIDNEKPSLSPTSYQIKDIRLLQRK